MLVDNVQDMAKYVKVMVKRTNLPRNVILSKHKSFKYREVNVDKSPVMIVK